MPETHQQEQQPDSTWGFVQLFYITLFPIPFGVFFTIGALTQTVVSLPLSCMTGCGRLVDDEVMEMLGGHGHCDAGWLLLWNRHLPKRSVARGRLSWTVSASQLPSTHPHTCTHTHPFTHPRTHIHTHTNNKHKYANTSIYTFIVSIKCEWIFFCKFDQLYWLIYSTQLLAEYFAVTLTVKLI